MTEILKWLVDLLINACIAASFLLGAGLVLVLCGLFLFLAYRFLTYWANRVAKRLIGLHTLSKVQRLYSEAEQGALVGLERVSRVEVVDREGRSYAKWGLADVKASWQDEGRTLKLFLKEADHEEGV